MVVYVIVLVVDTFYSDDWHALSQVDIYQTALCLVAFGRLDKRALHQKLFYPSCTYLL